MTQSKMQQETALQPHTGQADTGWSARSAEQAFQEQLQSLYRDVMDEPVPDDLLDLVRRLDQRMSDGDRSSR